LRIDRTAKQTQMQMQSKMQTVNTHSVAIWNAMQLDNADATEYRFLHETQPDRHMRGDGAKTHPRTRAYMPPKIQRSHLIGENLIARHNSTYMYCCCLVTHLLFCSNALLLQYSYARLIIRLSANTLTHSSDHSIRKTDLQKRGNDTKVGIFRCG
jgi:hypothetical protein